MRNEMPQNQGGLDATLHNLSTTQLGSTLLNNSQLNSTWLDFASQLHLELKTNQLPSEDEGYSTIERIGIT